MNKQIYESITSDKGFYLGDICYVLWDDLYDGVWCSQHHCADGSFCDPQTGLKVAVAGTSYGDGYYDGSDGTGFPVDSGTIGLVPLELVAKHDGIDDGKVFNYPGTAQFSAENGVFQIAFPDGKNYRIDTRN